MGGRRVHFFFAHRSRPLARKCCRCALRATVAAEVVPPHPGHLRRCVEKTGTHSQVELARLFAMFPPNDVPGP